MGDDLKREARVPLRRLRILLGLLVAILVGSACFLAVVKIRENSKLVARPVIPAHFFQTAAADRTGAVVWDSGRSSMVRGFNTDGQVVWTQQLPDREPFLSQCLAQCPDYVVSGNLASSPTTPDPDLSWWVAGHRSVESSNYDGHPGKRRVIAAWSPSVAVLQESDLTGNVRLELRDAPHPSTYVQLPVTAATELVLGLVNRGLTTAVTAWHDGRDHLNVEWLSRGANGWSRSAQTEVPADSHLGCLDANGSEVLIFGPASTISLQRSGKSAILHGVSGGNCTYNRVGPVVVQFDSLGTRVTQYTLSDRTVWTYTFAGEGVITTDPDAVDVVIGAATRSEVLSPSGEVKEVIASGSWGLSAGSDQFVYVDAVGGLHRANSG